MQRFIRNLFSSPKRENKEVKEVKEVEVKLSTDPLLAAKFFKLKETKDKKADVKKMNFTLPKSAETLDKFMEEKEGKDFIKEVSSLINKLKAWGEEYGLKGEYILHIKNLNKFLDKHFMEYKKGSGPTHITLYKEGITLLEQVHQLLCEKNHPLETRIRIYKDLLKGITESPEITHANIQNANFNLLDKVNFTLPQSAETLDKFMEEKTGETFKIEVFNFLDKLKAWGRERNLDITSLDEFFYKHFIKYEKGWGPTHIALYKEGIPLLEQVYHLLCLENLSPDTRIGIYKNLLNGLTVCAPGTYTNIQNAYYSLASDIDAELMWVRRSIAEQTTLDILGRGEYKHIYEGNITHYVNGVLNEHSAELGIKEVEDPFIKGCCNKEILAELNKDFKKIIAEKFTADSIINFIITFKLNSITEVLENKLKSDEKYMDVINDFEKQLNAYGQDNEYNLMQVLDGDAYAVTGKYQVRKDLEYYLKVTLFQRLSSLGVFYAKSLKKKMGYYLPSRGELRTQLSYLFVEDERIPLILYCAKQYADNHRDTISPVINDMSINDIELVRQESFKIIRNEVASQDMDDPNIDLFINKILEHKFLPKRTIELSTALKNEARFKFLDKFKVDLLDEKLEPNHFKRAFEDCSHLESYIKFVSKKGTDLVSLYEKLFSKLEKYDHLSIISNADDFYKILSLLSDEWTRFLASINLTKIIDSSEKLIDVLEKMNKTQFVTFITCFVTFAGKPYLHSLVTFENLHDYIIHLSDENVSSFLIFLDEKKLADIVPNSNKLVTILNKINSPDKKMLFLNNLGSENLKNIISDSEDLVLILNKISSSYNRMIFLNNIKSLLGNVINEIYEFDDLIKMIDPREKIFELLNEDQLLKIFNKWESFLNYPELSEYIIDQISPANFQKLVKSVDDIITILNYIPEQQHNAFLITILGVETLRKICNQKDLQRLTPYLSKYTSAQIFGPDVPKEKVDDLLSVSTLLAELKICVNKKAPIELLDYLLGSCSSQETSIIMDAFIGLLNDEKNTCFVIKALLNHVNQIPENTLERLIVTIMPSLATTEVLKNEYAHKLLQKIGQSHPTAKENIIKILSNFRNWDIHDWITNNSLVLLNQLTEFSNDQHRKYLQPILFGNLFKSMQSLDDVQLKITYLETLSKFAVHQPDVLRKVSKQLLECLKNESSFLVVHKIIQELNYLHIPIPPDAVYNILIKLESCRSSIDRIYTLTHLVEVLPSLKETTVQTLESLIDKSNSKYPRLIVKAVGCLKSLGVSISAERLEKIILEMFVNFDKDPMNTPIYHLANLDPLNILSEKVAVSLVDRLINLSPDISQAACCMDALVNLAKAFPFHVRPIVINHFLLNTKKATISPLYLICGISDVSHLLRNKEQLDLAITFMISKTIDRYCLVRNIAIKRMNQFINDIPDELFIKLTSNLLQNLIHDDSETRENACQLLLKLIEKLNPSGLARIISSLTTLNKTAKLNNYTECLIAIHKASGLFAKRVAASPSNLGIFRAAAEFKAHRHLEAKPDKPDGDLASKARI